MRAVFVPWSSLRCGHLFQTKEDAYPLRVLATFPGGVLVAERGFLVRVYFRPGVRVLRVFVGHSVTRSG